MQRGAPRGSPLPPCPLYVLRTLARGDSRATRREIGRGVLPMDVCTHRWIDRPISTVFRMFECACAAAHNLTSPSFPIHSSCMHSSFVPLVAIEITHGGASREGGTEKSPRALTTRGEFIRSPVCIFIYEIVEERRGGEVVRGYETEIESPRDPVGPELIKTSGIMRASWGIARDFAGRRAAR